MNPYILPAYNTPGTSFPTIAQQYDPGVKYKLHITYIAIPQLE